MSPFLQLSRLIDWFSGMVGRLAMLMVLASTLISAGNAIVRKLFGTSSNAWLEIQWYLFAAVFMLGSGYAFLKNAHVRIDFVSGKFSARTRNWIDVGGIIIFLLPLCYLMISLSWTLVANAISTGEISTNAGGLIRWPVYMLIPVGFGLLGLQSISELIKRFHFLFGNGADPLDHTGPSETEMLAKEIAAEEHEHAAHQKPAGQN